MIIDNIKITEVLHEEDAEVIRIEGYRMDNGYDTYDYFPIAPWANVDALVAGAKTIFRLAW